MQVKDKLFGASLITQSWILPRYNPQKDLVSLELLSLCHATSSNGFLSKKKAGNSAPLIFWFILWSRSTHLHLPVGPHLSPTGTSKGTPLGRRKHRLWLHSTILSVVLALINVSSESSGRSWKSSKLSKYQERRSGGEKWKYNISRLYILLCLLLSHVMSIQIHGKVQLKR